MTLYIRCGLVFILSIGLCASVLSHDGEVKITGTIQDNTCELAPDSQKNFIPMGKVAKSQFTEVGDFVPAKSFSLSLQNCGPAASEATVTFSGTPDEKNNKLFALNELPDSATGLALGIYDANGMRIAPGETSKGVALQPGQTAVKLWFAARYESVEESVTAGKAVVTVTFIVNYG